MTSLFRRLALPALALAAALTAACNCGQSTGRIGGPGDSASNQTCAAGDCDDGGVLEPAGCVDDTGCPEGLRCLVSRGLCVPGDAGTTPELDGGIYVPPGACVPGEVVSCGSSKVGACRLGTAQCGETDGGWQFLQCEGAVAPLEEACDGRDEDCDGVTDDSLGQSTCGVGACRRVQDNCVGGGVEDLHAGRGHA